MMCSAYHPKQTSLNCFVERKKMLKRSFHVSVAIHTFRTKPMAGMAIRPMYQNDVEAWASHKQGPMCMSDLSTDQTK